MSPVLWMLVGAWIGAPIGVLAIALCQAAARGDAHLDPTSRRQAEMEQRVWDAANRSNE
ncbi:MAG TPA: hypothetical protein VFN07_10980 [Trueperaceae bacterium]|nr:hypothetical protein [Trueperaceae bacterium]